uniref:phosphopyruvate hydratase n=1 Tax=Populus trichocarpa TaxID=3694 RepID=A0A2K2C355_POPTR
MSVQEYLDNFRASVPSGDVSGIYEAVELRDGDKGRYLGNSVSRAVKNINEKISEALIDMDPALQSQIDQAMIDLDKTENKGELGANAITWIGTLCTSLKILPLKYQLPLYKDIYDLSGKTNLTLPVPAFTVISGGKHAGNNLAVQVVGDDLLMSNLKRIERTLHESSCNALLLKVCS